MNLELRGRLLLEDQRVIISLSLTQTWHMKVLAGARSALQKTLLFRSGWPGGTEHTEPGGLWGEAPSAARGMSQVVSGIALSPSAVTSRLSCTAPGAAQLGSESAALHGGPGHRGPPGAFPRSARGFLPALFIPEMRVTHAFTSKARLRRRRLCTASRPPR